MSAWKEKLKNNRIVRKAYYAIMGGLKKTALLLNAKKAMEVFYNEIKAEDKDRIAKDMVKMYAKHGFGFDEYLCYSFDKKTMSERLEFVADWEHLGYTCALNKYENASLFDDKWKTYCKYNEFYGRKVLFGTKSTTEEEFASFCGGNDRFIVKPLDSSCGRGIKIIDIAQGQQKNVLEVLLQEYNGRFVIEEMIVQHAEMAKMHPSSVNTLRVATVRMNDGVKIIHSFMRVGRHGKTVDNAGAGGLICCLDNETGSILTVADEMGYRYTEHPDTHEPLIGFTVPRWEEAKELVARLALVTPENRYTGWDIALTEKGWIMVEANRRGQFVWQIPTQIGFRKEINNILKQVGKKY